MVLDVSRRVRRREQRGEQREKQKERRTSNVSSIEICLTKKKVK